ncbi:hypothetical protein GCM10009039_04170 [Halocalculus aciditolerans]|uniref:HTH iclR-type domain-containing protein n=1 Tax=Halocalculus aciditolerans TaxID=1383812 RepID=A0A830FF43_9EURY|nr:hypothetical protein GCM10009039_04170 [Halocalculus aciditolerans]
MAAASADADPGPSDIVIGVNVHENGDATWNVTATYPLNSSTDRRAFARLSDEFTRGGDVFVQPGVFESAASTASERTGRPMSVTDVRYGTDVRNRTGVNATGVLTLKFRWNGFANATAGNITVGDAFSGSLLGDLTERETLYIAPPDGYRPLSSSSSDQVRNGAIYWTGPYEFASGGPSVQFTEGSGPLFGGFGAVAVLVVLALVVGGAVAYVVVGRSDRDLPGLGSTSDAPPDEASATEPDEEAAEEPDGDAEAAGGGAAGAAGAAGDSGVDEELLSDEERVERLLEANGGRMKQAKIVEETRWSNAKVSQLLSSMAEEGRVEKLRIGRENLISLPEEAEE